MKLTGKWKKVSSAPCDAQYPDEIEFYDRPRYLARKGPAQGFIFWDAGTYEVSGEGRVKLSVATDAQVTYKYKLSGDLLTFVDDRGCEFQYRRVG